MHHAPAYKSIVGPRRLFHPPSEVMETNLELEQADRLFQSNVEHSLTSQVRVTNSDCDGKVCVLGVSPRLVPLTGVRYWIQSLQVQKAPPVPTLVQ